MRRRSGGFARSSPKRRNWPELGCSTVASSLTRVVLPAPLGPKIVRLSPARSSRSRSASAANDPKRFPSLTASTTTMAQRHTEKAAPPPGLGTAVAGSQRFLLQGRRVHDSRQTPHLRPGDRRRGDLASVDAALGLVGAGRAG